MGRLTTHVLDTARGRPAAGLRLQLFQLGEERPLVGDGGSGVIHNHQQPGYSADVADQPADQEA